MSDETAGTGKAKDYDADLIGGKWLSLFNSLLGQGDVTVYDN